VNEELWVNTPDFVIQNDGQRIVSTTFWQTEQAKRGFMFVSGNAGVYRLLIPDPTIPQVAEWMQADRVRLEGIDPYGYGWVHLLFDDDSDQPCFLTIRPVQCVPLPGAQDLGRWTELVAYVPDGDMGVRELHRWPLFIHRVMGDQPQTNRVPQVPVARH